MSLVEEAIRSWEVNRALTIAELENTPESGLEYRPGEGARTLREIAIHIAHAGAAITAEILRPDGTFKNLFDPQVQAQLVATLPPARTRAQIVELLRVTGEQGAARLRDVGDDLAVQTMPTLAGVESRLSALWFGVAHEMYHRGQLAIGQRGIGTVPALTQRIAAMLAG